MRDEYAKAIGGDAAYTKKISNTLRLLVCVSDKTEGLLWRIAEAIGANDSIELQASRGINKDNPLVDSLGFVLIPFCRPGKAPIPFPAIDLSLKTFIKEFEALYFNKRSYTHEQLIKLISQQMGSSHEAEGVDPLLIDLSGISFSQRPALVEFLLAHASFALDVGEKILEFARSKTGFQRRTRPEIVIPARVVEPFSFVEDEHFQGREENNADHGISLVASAPHIGWETDGRAHNFGPATVRGVTCTIEKSSDGRLEVKVYTSSKIIIKQQAIKPRGKLDIVVFIRKKDGERQIIIDGGLE